MHYLLNVQQLKSHQRQNDLEDMITRS